MKKRPVKSVNRLVTKKKRRRAIDPATRQLIIHIATGVGVFSVLLLLVTGIWYGTRVEMLTIETVNVAGGQTISHDEVREAAAATLNGSYFALVPKRFAWTYPQTQMLSAVAAISRIKDPVIERVSGSEIQITVDEYIPYALWCREESESDCLFVDADGVAFAPAPALEGGSLYRFFTLGTDPAVASTMREKVALDEVITIAESLENNFLLPVTKIELDSVGDVFFRVVGGGEIKVSLTQAPTTTLENLALVLSADDFKDLAPGTFQYIDLRFGSKVFVNDTLPVVATTTLETDGLLSDAPDTGVSILDEVVEQLTEADATGTAVSSTSEVASSEPASSESASDSQASASTTTSSATTTETAQ